MSGISGVESADSALQAKGYKIIKKLGEGAYAKVYLAEYQKDKQKQQQQLACKVVNTRLAPKEFVSKFLPRELDILVKLNHPYIIHVHSIFAQGNKYYIFMRYAQNGDLLDFITDKGPVKEAQARIWFRQLTLAIQYLHGLDIAHRDLKCENALITANFNIKVADLGFARYVSDDKGKQLRSSTYCGSLTYAAPEILFGNPYLPKFSDIWSLGVILYVMLNKALPFEENNAKRLRESQMKKRWHFRSHIASTVSDNVKTLVSLLLEPEPEKRYTVEQILTSEWISMDARLIGLTDIEKAAKTQVIEKNIKLAGPSKMDKKNEITVLKEASRTVTRVSVTIAPNVSAVKK